MMQDQDGQNQQSVPKQPVPSPNSQSFGHSNNSSQTAGTPPTDSQNPTKESEDKTPANFQLGALLPKELKVKIPSHQLQFDEDQFLKLLAGSISLNKQEKKKIIESIPKLKQYQIDELIRIFEEEKQKFSQLSVEHIPQLEKLANVHLQDWLDLETDIIAQTKKDSDDTAADEIRKSLGI